MPAISKHLWVVNNKTAMKEFWKRIIIGCGLENKWSSGLSRQGLYLRDLHPQISFCAYFSNRKAAVPDSMLVQWGQRARHGDCISGQGHLPPFIPRGVSWGTAWLPHSQLPSWCNGSYREVKHYRAALTDALSYLFTHFWSFKWCKSVVYL